MVLGVSVLQLLWGNIVNNEVTDLLLHCRQARSAGQDFPSIWSGILKGHPLVLGSPVQGHDGETARLAVRLLGDFALVFDGDDFSVE